jgi:hypothetical protein
VIPTFVSSLKSNHLRSAHIRWTQDYFFLVGNFNLFGSRRGLKASNAAINMINIVELSRSGIGVKNLEYIEENTI